MLEDWAQATSVELPPVPAVIDERATYRWDDGTCINILFPEHSADAELIQYCTVLYRTDLWGFFVSSSKKLHKCVGLTCVAYLLSQ